MKMGSDPEFFFHKRTLMGKMGSVIGAEKVLPKNGLKLWPESSGNKSRFIIDGVQAEMNPESFTCRQSMGGELSAMVRTIKKLAEKKRVIINWAPLVKVSPKEMRSLSPENKKFGCEPSHNAYDDYIPMPDPEKYLFRSAGGHMHFGAYFSSGDDMLTTAIKKDNKTVVMLLDIILGNTCVMIDRDPGNIERRKFYGRAGEYRLPTYGLEYRVLSNFWLRSYKMMSMVFGISRIAFGFALNEEAKEALFAAVKEKDIRKAINENDAVLAKKNWKAIRPIIAKYSTTSNSLHQNNLVAFDHFVEKGMDHYFKTNPTDHWTGSECYTGAGWGFESFLEGIKVDIQNDKKAKASKK
jgi:hypothetical protein